MLIQVDERFHDYEEETYYVTKEAIEAGSSPLDKIVLEALKNKDYVQTIYVNVAEKRDTNIDRDFWEEPGLSGGRGKLSDGQRPDRNIKLILDFDC